jgi:membrane protein DedA with SNARE-associated domain
LLTDFAQIDNVQTIMEIEPTTISAKILVALSSLSGPYAYGAILGMLFVCGIGVPLPEDITLISAGMLAAAGSISLPGAFVAGYVGVLMGDVLLFLIGRKYGRRVFQLPVFRRIFTEERIIQAEQAIQKSAGKICFTARFLPGLRAPIYLTAGILKVRPTVFLLQDGLAALLSVPIWVVVGYEFGQEMETVLHVAKQIQTYLIAGILFLIAFWLFRRMHKKRLKKNEIPL